MAMLEPISMPDSETSQVKELHRILNLGLPELVGPDAKERIKIPPSVYELLKRVVHDLQLGRSIALMREDANFTTQQAANFLGVSRPHLIGLLESGMIPFHKIGSHRRVRCGDLVSYARVRNQERRRILDDLAKEAFDSGLYGDVGIPLGGEDE